MTTVLKNQVYQMTITNMTSEGNGVGHIGDFAVFVPDVITGDVASIKVVKVQKTYGFGIVEELITPSASRTPIDCTVFHQCGGCSYRHVRYDAECVGKQQIVEDCFTRLGGFTKRPEPILGSKCSDGYRNKAQFPVGYDEKGELVYGFYAKRSHRVIKSEDCKLQPPIFHRIADDIITFMKESRITAYREHDQTGLVRHLYFRLGESSGEIMVCIVATAPRLPREKLLVKLLVARYPQIKTIVVNVNKRNTNVILGRQCRVLYGDGTIADTMCGVNVQISPLAFYQVNHAQAQRLYAKAAEYAQPDGQTLLDLYCGIGTIGLSMASRLKKLIGVEVIPEAVENANGNALRNGFENTTFLCADAGAASQILQEQGEQVDIVIIDPPRKGCDEPCLAQIVALSPARVVMVSCNPATAARDCRYLCEHGYTLIEYTPVDLFPRTTHVEKVVLLSHKNS